MTLRWQSRDLTKNTAQRSDGSYQNRTITSGAAQSSARRWAGAFITNRNPGELSKPAAQVASIK